MKLLQIILVLYVFIPTIVLAATPTISDIEKEIIVPKEAQSRQESLIELDVVKKFSPAMVEDTSGKTILVKGFKFENVTRMNEETLVKRIASYTNQELSFSQIQEVVTVITEEYRKQGYFVARAYLPVQDINKDEGILTIAVIEGEYGDFNLTNSSRVRHSIVQRVIKTAKSRGSIISTDTLERAMLLVNDLPGVVVTKAQIRPGKEVGASDLDIETQPTNLYDGYILSDNAGSKFTGKYRFMTGLNINSLIGYGDKVSLSGLVSNRTDLTNAKAAYSAPLMSNGLRGELSYSQTNYSLVKLSGTPDNQYTGLSRTVEGKLSYPLIRTKLKNLYTNLIIGTKDLRDKFIGSLLNPRDAQYVKASAEYGNSYLFFNKNNTSGWAFTFTHGKLSFDNSADRVTDEAGANTNGSYSKINLDLSHKIELSKKFSLESNLLIQQALSNKNLDGSEDLSIGGSNGVKLYPSGELSAENGYVFNIEAKYHLPEYNGLQHSLGVFYDVGRVNMSDNTVGFASRTLQDVGVGYYTKYKNYFGKIQVAFKVGREDITSEADSDSRILFQVGIVF